MIDRMKSLKETLENHILSLKGQLEEVKSQQSQIEEKITYTQGRVFELQEVIEFISNTSGENNGTDIQGENTNGSGADSKVG